MNKRDEIVVFLGPSLPPQEAVRLLPATYLPPAEQGDIAGVVTDLKPRVIALIDGVFLSRPAVWHKEILYALSRGIHVFGASSMGALRASELAEFGMKGVGSIFERFASGEFLDDDEVALVHEGADHEFRPLTEPMVNIRATLDAAVQAQVITSAEQTALIQLAKDVYFAQRTRAAFFRAARDQGLLPPSSTLPSFFESNYVDAKRQDALALLAHVEMLPTDLPPFEPSFELSSNRLFQTLLQKDAALFDDGTKISRGDVTAHFTLHDKDFDYLNFNAMNRSLVLLLADLLGASCSAADIQSERRRFKTRHNLTEVDTFSNWLRDNHLDLDQFESLMRQRAICRRLHRWLWLKQGRLGSIGFLTEELVLTDRYVATLRKVTLQQQLIDSYAPYMIDTENDDTTDVDELLNRHLQYADISIDQNYQTWLHEANFPSHASLAYELIKAAKAREALSSVFQT